jgi:hypothetical protein
VVDGIGQVTFLVDATLVNAVTANITPDLALELSTSGGMTAQKYRTQLMKKVGGGIATEMGNTFITRNEATKVIRFTVVMISIGLILGVTGSKKTNEKTIGATMENRAEQDDGLGIAWRVIKTCFRTYVNEPGVDQSLFPSLKFCSSCPEYALLGVTILAEKVMTLPNLIDALQKPYIEWPDLYRKQWIGNFALSKEFQMEHMVWEKTFWNAEVTTTNNAANTGFKRGFTPKYYETTIRDKFLVVLPNGQMVWPTEAGYSKADFAKLIVLIYIQTSRTKASVYVRGGNAFSFNGNVAAVAPAAPFVYMNALPALEGVNAATIRAIEAIAATPAPVEITSSSDENIKGLVSAVNSVALVRPAGLPADAP